MTHYTDILAEPVINLLKKSEKTLKHYVEPYEYEDKEGNKFIFISKNVAIEIILEDYDISLLKKKGDAVSPISVAIHIIRKYLERGINIYYFYKLSKQRKNKILSILKEMGKLNELQELQKQEIEISLIIFESKIESKKQKITVVLIKEVVSKKEVVRGKSLRRKSWRRYIYNVLLYPPIILNEIDESGIKNFLE